MFLKLWIKLCPFCKLAVADYDYTPPELLITEKWSKEFIAKYLIASRDWKVANSNGAICHNQNCKAYQKFSYRKIKKWIIDLFHLMVLERFSLMVIIGKCLILPFIICIKEIPFFKLLLEFGSLNMRVIIQGFDQETDIYRKT